MASMSLPGTLSPCVLPSRLIKVFRHEIVEPRPAKKTLLAREPAGKNEKETRRHIPISKALRSQAALHIVGREYSASLFFFFFGIIIHSVPFLCPPSLRSPPHRMWRQKKAPVGHRLQCALLQGSSSSSFSTAAKGCRRVADGEGVEEEPPHLPQIGLGEPAFVPAGTL